MNRDMPEKRKNERRKQKDRRTRKMDELFNRAVKRGDLEDVRKGDRRKKKDRRKKPVDIKVYLN